ncbi:MAG TPA: rod shape-determining protein MreD [Burkholderiales bacterium]|nr:rod shape-determining protein MreD [Burkholderiales bacterium]
MAFDPRFQGIPRPVNVGFMALTAAAAMLFNLLPWSDVVGLPDLLALVIAFWCVHEPRKMGIGFAWALGLLMDAGNGALMGQHAFAYAILAFGAIALHRRILWFSAWAQAAHVLILLVASELLMLLVRMAAGGAYPGLAYFIGPVIAGALWPVATYVLLIPQRRPRHSDEPRSI